MSDGILIDTTMYFIKCREIDEARYLSAIINSQALYDKAQALMPKGQYGPRDVHKHIWRLPIPNFDPTIPNHVTLANLCAQAEQETTLIATQQPNRNSVRATRAIIRDWQMNSAIGQSTEALIQTLLPT